MPSGKYCIYWNKLYGHQESIGDYLEDWNENMDNSQSHKALRFFSWKELC